MTVSSMATSTSATTPRGPWTWLTTAPAATSAYTSGRLAMGQTGWVGHRSTAHRSSCRRKCRQAAMAKLLACTAGHTTRGGQGHVMRRDRVAPQFEVIRAIVLEGSPCCEVPHCRSRSAARPSPSRSLRGGVAAALRQHRAAAAAGRRRARAALLIQHSIGGGRIAVDGLDKHR